MVRTRKLAAVVLGLFMGGLCLVGAAQEPKKNAPPDGEKKGKGGFDKGKGFPGPGGFGFGRMGQPGQIMPTFLQGALKMTDDQKKELEALQKEVDAKLDKILTEDQRKQLKEMRERGPGGFGRPFGGEGKGPFGPPKKKDD